MATQNFNAWDSADEIEGLDLLDKSHLVEVPFRITSVRFVEGNNGVRRVEVDAENQEGNTFTFQDSSTGVKTQIEQYLALKGLDAAIETGEPVEINLIARNGLRVSKYMVPEKGPNGQDIRGRYREARTYYLTTSGRRAPAAKPAPAKRAPTAK